MTYTPNQIQQALNLLETITVRGTANCKAVAMIAQILASPRPEDDVKKTDQNNIPT